MSTAWTLAALLATFDPQQETAKPPDLAPTRVEVSAHETISIHGTAIAIDASGVEREHENGLLRFTQWPTGVLDVPVRDGKFEVTVVASSKLLTPRLQLGGRSVQLRSERKIRDRSVQVTSESVDVDASGTVALRGKWGDDVELRVVDAESRELLEDCEWIHDSSFRVLVNFDDRRSLDAQTLQHVASPLQLAQVGRYWIRAPGHAWQLYEFDDRPGASKDATILALPRACALEVELPEARVKDREWLIVDALPDRGEETKKRDDRAPDTAVGIHPLRWFVRRGSSRTIRLQSLPPGRLLVRVVLEFDLKPWFVNEVPLATATVEVALDRANRVTIPSESIPAGLHDDGTVDRTGIVKFAGAKPGAAGPKSGTIDGAFVERDPTQLHDRGLRGSGLIARLTPNDFAASSNPPVEVVDGFVNVRVPYGCLLDVGNAVLDGVAYRLSRNPVLADTTDDPFTIEIPDHDSLGGPTTIVHVVDKQTHAELQHVSIAPNNTFDRPREFWTLTSSPGAVPRERLLVADGCSPVRLHDSTGFKREERLYIRAAGYAWTNLHQDWTKAGERTVELERACDISITLEPTIDAKGMELLVFPMMDREKVIRDCKGALASVLDGTAIRRSDHDSYVADLRQDIATLESADYGVALLKWSPTILATEVPDPSGTTRIEGLPLGRLGVALSNPNEVKSPIGLTLIDATAGGEIPVVIHVPTTSMRAAVPLAGIATIPREWRATGALIRVIPVDALASSLQPTISRALTPDHPDDPECESFSWDAGTVQPGTYRLVVEMLGPEPHDARYARRFAVGASGETRVRIDVPKPCDVQIKLMDAATDTPVTVDYFAWHPADDADASDLGSSLVASEIGTDGTLKFRCPAERIRLWIHDRKLGDRDELLDLASPEYHGTIRFIRRGGIHLQWKRGERVATQDRFIFSTLFSIAPDGTATEIDVFDEMSDWIPVPKPGRYRVEFGIEVDDDEVRSAGVAPIEVTVPSDSFVDVDVQLPEPKKKKDG